jgi:cytochrome d ubiquinol oxidase subunit I
MSAWALWRSRRGGKPFELGRWTLWVLVACIASPFLANTAGWIFTEMGRQPWIVYGLLKTVQAESPTVSVADVAFTLGGFALLYTVLGVIDVILMYLSARHGLGDVLPRAGSRRATATELVYYDHERTSSQPQRCG